MKMAIFPTYKSKLAMVFLLCPIVKDFYFQLKNNVLLFPK